MQTEEAGERYAKITAPLFPVLLVTDPVRMVRNDKSGE